MSLQDDSGAGHELGDLGLRNTAGEEKALGLFTVERLAVDLEFLDTEPGRA